MKKDNHPVVLWASAVNEVTFAYKHKVHKTVSVMPLVRSSSQSADILRNQYETLLINDIEYFSVLFMNHAQRVIGFQVISQGGIAGTVADPRIIFKAAILAGATNLILCHNHPPGNLQPSDADKRLTDKMVQSGKMLDIKILDHIILTDSNYTSFADEGWI